MRKRASMRSIIMSLGVLALAGAWYLRNRADDDWHPAGEAESGGDPALLLDRVWIDSRPVQYTDYAHVLFVLKDAPLGLFQKASAYQATLELFEYRRRESKLAVHFPQTGKRRDIGFRIRTCKDLPPFDLCLELNQNPWGGPRRYYAMSDSDKEKAELGDIRHELEHRLDEPSPPWQGPGLVPR